MTKKNVLIIGAGFGGIEAARKLAKYKDIVDVTLVTKQDGFLYYPALYKLAAQSSTAFSGLYVVDMVPKNIKIIVGEVIGINKLTKKISFFDKEDLNYDILVLAMGSVTEDFGTPGVREHMCQFRTLDDIHCLRGLINKHLETNHTEPIIVVGGGPTGVELAACIHDVFEKEASCGDESHNHVLIIEGSPSVVAQLPDRARHAIKNRLVKMGLGVYTGVRVTSYDGHILKTSTGEFISKTVVWAAGLAAHPLLKEIGGEYDKKGRVIVNDSLESTVDENIYIIGDSASTQKAGLAQTAIYDGNFVAKTIVSKIKNKKRPVYNQPNVGYAVPVGPRWGVASFGGLIFTGLLGSFIRDIIDFNYLITHHSFDVGIRIFRSSHRN
jgi:NADH dehydrogenase